MRKKGVFLEYSIEIALIGREGGNILSVKQNLAFVRGLKSADNAQGCCLAAAGGLYFNRTIKLTVLN